MHGSPRFILSSLQLSALSKHSVQNQSTWKQMTLSVTGGLMSGTEGDWFRRWDGWGGMTDCGDGASDCQRALLSKDTEEMLSMTGLNCLACVSDTLQWYFQDIHKQGDLGRVTEELSEGHFHETVSFVPHLCPHDLLFNVCFFHQNIRQFYCSSLKQNKIKYWFSIVLISEIVTPPLILTIFYLIFLMNKPYTNKQTNKEINK